MDVKSTPEARFVQEGWLPEDPAALARREGPQPHGTGMLEGGSCRECPLWVRLWLASFG